MKRNGVVRSCTNVVDLNNRARSGVIYVNGARDVIIIVLLFLAVVVSSDDNMSQSLRAVRLFRLRELIPPPKAIQSTATLSERPAALSRSGAVPNPFVPHRNPQSGRWAPPKYSLRRQADLIKHARASGTLHLLPPGPKMSMAQLAASAASHPAADRASEEVEVSGLTNRRPAVQQEAQDINNSSSSRDEDAAWTGPVEWVGSLRERSVAGADVGNRLYAGKKRMFKGHKWERTRERRITRTKILLRDMDKRVERFKQYRAKGKPLPLARRSNLLKKTQKLPF